MPDEFSNIKGSSTTMDLHPPPRGRTQPRYTGIATFMGLPYLDSENIANVDIGLIGVPWDGGTSNRPGARLAPREMRSSSTMMRSVNHDTGIAPYEIANCADLGDVPVNPLALDKTMSNIEDFYRHIYQKGILPLTAGGDHLISLPILRALARDRSVGLIHFDAHSDTVDRQFIVSELGHGTPFRRAIEEELIDPKRTIQIGIRGGFHVAGDLDWALDKGLRIITIEEYRRLGVDSVIEEIKKVAGVGLSYVTFDVDSLDPVYAPGTGTPEIGGLTTLDAQLMIRSLGEVNLVGGDVVEVSPPLDPTGLTTLTGTTLMWEILCAMTCTITRRKSKR